MHASKHMCVSSVQTAAGLEMLLHMRAFALHLQDPGFHS